MIAVPTVSIAPPIIVFHGTPAIICFLSIEIQSSHARNGCSRRLSESVRAITRVRPQLSLQQWNSATTIHDSHHTASVLARSLRPEEVVVELRHVAFLPRFHSDHGALVSSEVLHEQPVTVTDQRHMLQSRQRCDRRATFAPSVVQVVPHEMFRSPGM